jgi:replicative DNA helicase
MSSEKKNSAERIPPQNLDAEKSLLGAILLSDNIFPDILEVVKSTDFYDQRHSLIFQAMTTLYERSTPIDLLTLQDEMKKQKTLNHQYHVNHLC